MEDSCEQQSSCDDCKKLPFCGWCDNHYCLEGNSTTAFSTSCDTWTFGLSSDCAFASSCKHFNDCFSCTQELGCGWCNETFCTEGSKSGSSIGQCTLWSYNVTDSLCADEQLVCSKHLNCSSCASDPSDRCGWCESSGQCLVYDGENQPANCFFWKEKVCTPTCKDFSHDCGKCIENDNCGWCNSSLCVEGITSGPTAIDVQCQTWGFENCPYDCALFSEACSTCNGFPACGWCENEPSSLCMQSVNSSECGGLWEINGNCQPITTPCNTYSSCSTCVASPSCNWCGSDYGCEDAPSQLGKSNPCVQTCSKTPKLSTTEIVLIIVSCSIVGVGGFFGFLAFYRIYWTKRHYYETLK